MEHLGSVQPDEDGTTQVNHFSLFAHGEAFDVDAYLTSSRLKPDDVWRRGESLHTTSGIRFMLGDGLTIPFLMQEAIAIDFLKAHRDELQALARRQGADTFVLGFQYHAAFESDVLGFCLGPSVALMRHCLEVGCEPTYYVSLDRVEDTR